MRKMRKTEKVGEDESEEESTDDSEEEKQPALESAVDEQNVAGTSAVRSEMERASRVLADALSSTNQPIEKDMKTICGIESNSPCLMIV